MVGVERNTRERSLQWTGTSTGSSFSVLSQKFVASPRSESWSAGVWLAPIGRLGRSFHHSVGRDARRERARRPHSTCEAAILSANFGLRTLGSVDRAHD